MVVRQPRYPKEEFAQRGDRIYETRIQSIVEAGNKGRIVAIDIETGSYELADDILSATNALFDRIPDTQLGRSHWNRAVHRFGARSLKYVTMSSNAT